MAAQVMTFIRTDSCSNKSEEDQGKVAEEACSALFDAWNPGMHIGPNRMAAMLCPCHGHHTQAAANFSQQLVSKAKAD